jgi:chemotaxis protein methyltransferase CheR
MISDAPLSQLSDRITERTGLRFPRERWGDLQRGINGAAGEFGFDDVDSCVRWLLSSSLTREQVEILASYLTVGETYFFREDKTFGVLEEALIPEFVASRRGGEQRLRIWSAGCATGEEPYSMAMLLTRTICDLNDWNVTLLATDINPRFLQKASRGTYGDWSFRGCPNWVKEKYFRKTKDGRFEIARNIKDMVTFSRHNLAGDPYPSLVNNTNAMDFIFCRNVLMYFAPEQIGEVVQRLSDCLVEGGYLIVSPSEASHVLYPQFTAVNYPGVILYRKENRVPPARPSFRPAVVLPEVPSETINIPLQPLRPAVERSPESGPPLEPENLPAREAGQPEVVERERVTYEQALASYEQGDYLGAEENITALLSSNNADSKARALLARIYANQGRLSEALECGRKAIAADKLNPAYYYLLATILQEQNQFEEAARSLKQALYVDQDFALAHFALGNLALRQRNIHESYKSFGNALSLLETCQPEDVLPESEGMTAGRLREIIRAAIITENTA